jgi:hypothetical protein
MTATPHNGKEEDFQLFLSLLDSDRFYGKFRDGVHKVDASDLMRRMVEEGLKFDGTPLFPERPPTPSTSILTNANRKAQHSSIALRSIVRNRGIFDVGVARLAVTFRSCRRKVGRLRQ